MLILSFSIIICQVVLLWNRPKLNILMVCCVFVCCCLVCFFMDLQKSNYSNPWPFPHNSGSSPRSLLVPESKLAFESNHFTSLKFSHSGIWRHIFCLVSMRAISVLPAPSENKPPWFVNRLGLPFFRDSKCANPLSTASVRDYPHFPCVIIPANLKLTTTTTTEMSYYHSHFPQTQTSGSRISINCLPTEEQVES